MSQQITIDVNDLEYEDTETISRTIYYTVAEANGIDPLDLPPLGETIDSEALELFVNRSSDEVEFSLTFNYAGCDVTVTETEIIVESNDEQ